MADINKVQIVKDNQTLTFDIKDSTARATADSKSTVAVSTEGTSKEKINYITIDGVENKIGGGEVNDVQVNGTSVLNVDTGVANITKGDDIWVTEGQDATGLVDADTLEEHPASYFQQALVSGTNIKTLNSESLLGSGDIVLTKTSIGLDKVENTSDLNKPISTATQTALNKKQDTLVSGTNIKTVHGQSVLGSGDINPIASASQLGGVKIGSGINVSTDGTISAQEYSLPTASSTTLGGVKIGSGININNGVISAQEYSLPTATADTKGGVKIGSGINVTTDGTISAQEYSLPTASATVKGGIKVGTNLAMNGEVLNNTYTLPTATSSVLGGVKTGSNITNSSGTISLTSSNVTSALGYTPPKQDTTYSTATQSANGLMSSTDKTKLDGIATGANNYSLPTATSSVLGGVKTGSNITNSSGTISLTKTNVTSALGYTPPTTNTTYSTGTASTSGITKLYTGTGTNTDGTMTQSAINTALSGKLNTTGTAAKATADASGNTITSTYATKTELNTKQATLVSGTNIKTVNSTSLLGSGNIAVQPTLVSGTNIKTINGNSLLGSGDITIEAGISYEVIEEL